LPDTVSGTQRSWIERRAYAASPVSSTVPVSASTSTLQWPSVWPGVKTSRRVPSPSTSCSVSTSISRQRDVCSTCDGT
jgi:hypothetical protein